MDRVVPVPALELGQLVEPQRRERGRVGENHETFVIDDPDG
jgi:hypothetical protein